MKTDLMNSIESLRYSLDIPSWISDETIGDFINAFTVSKYEIINEIETINLLWNYWSKEI